VSASGVVHSVAAVAIPLAALAAAWRAGRSGGRPLAMLTGALGAVALLAGVRSQQAWEQGPRRALYLASHVAGEWLDRKTHLGLAACAFAVALALTALDGRTPRWLQRLLAMLTALFALGALATLLYARA
jgi:hypothetical protein